MAKSNISKDELFVKDVAKTQKDVLKYFNTLSAKFTERGLNYDKAYDAKQSKADDIPEGKIHVIKAFLVKEGDSNILDINMSADTFTLSAFAAIEELLNDIGDAVEFIDNSIALISIDVPLDELPEETLFSEGRESFTLSMKDFSTKDINILTTLKVQHIVIMQDRISGRIIIQEFNASGENVEYNISMK